MEWIRVKDRLPDSNGKHLIRSEEQGQSGHAIWNGSDWESVVMTKGSLMLYYKDEISEWMQLPEKPE